MRSMVLPFELGLKSEASHERMCVSELSQEELAFLPGIKLLSVLAFVSEWFGHERFDLTRSSFSFSFSFSIFIFKHIKRSCLETPC